MSSHHLENNERHTISYGGQSELIVNIGLHDFEARRFWRLWRSL